MGGCLVRLRAGNLQVILQYCPSPNEVGLWTGIGNLAGVIAPIAIGYIIKFTGSYTPASILAALVLVFDLLAYWFIVGKLEMLEPKLTT
jgi:nitrate/nitrite transporter NarK